MPVAVDVVDGSDRWPVLVLAYPGKRVGRVLALVGVAPVVRRDGLGGVGRVLDDVVLAVGSSLLDVADFLAYLDEGVAEAVELRGWNAPRWTNTGSTLTCISFRFSDAQSSRS